LVCPDCGQVIADKEGIPLTVKDISKKRMHCTNEIEPDKICNSSLWQANREGPRRYALSEYIKKNYSGYFDFLILDECHEYKARGSAQGFAVAALASASKRVLAMTGTV
ncbi:MAG: ATP-dependent helicase, partial [bacterium]